MQNHYSLISTDSDNSIPDWQISMSNRVARASQELKLTEKRLISMALSLTDSQSTREKFLAIQNSGWKVRLNAIQYSSLFNVDPSTAYEQLKLSSASLFHRYIRYTTPGKRNKPVEHFFRWVSSANYMEGEGVIELNFTPEIAPHLLGLEANFTTYKLKHSVGFDSIYAWRLYELLKSWTSTGIYEPLIDDFHHSMESPASCRKDFSDLRKRVIEPAIKGINQKSDLIVQYTPIRFGSRKVSALRFQFVPNPQQRLPIDGEAPNSDMKDQSPTNPENV